jgi:hypothetical protein
MTDRLNYLTVALEQDIREDDAQALISAIQMLRGVLSVTGHVAAPNEWVIRQRVRNELRDKLWKIVMEDE